MRDENSDGGLRSSGVVSMEGHGGRETRMTLLFDDTDCGGDLISWEFGDERGTFPLAGYRASRDKALEGGRDPQVAVRGYLRSQRVPELIPVQFFALGLGHLLNDEDYRVNGPD